MQGFDAAVKHFRKAGELLNRCDGNAFLREQFGGAAGRDDLDATLGELDGKFGDAGFVRDDDQGASDAVHEIKC